MKPQHWGILLVFLGGCQTGQDPIASGWELVESKEAAQTWQPTNHRLAYHPQAESRDSRAEWLRFGEAPEEAIVSADLMTPFELVVEVGIGPRALGIPYSQWNTPAWLGVGGPFAGADGTIHVYECPRESPAVYRRDRLLMWCRPDTMRFFVAVIADYPKPIDGIPDLPEPIRQWWSDKLAFSLGDLATRAALAPALPFVLKTKDQADGCVAQVMISTGAHVPGELYRHQDEIGMVERWRVANRVVEGGHR